MKVFVRLIMEKILKNSNSLQDYSVHTLKQWFTY